MKKVVTIGGGTGTFVVLSALRTIPDLSLSAIVSSADDGGSTGRLRDAYGFLPLGDARQALVALAEHGDVMRDLFAYRFSKGDVRGHNLGNLFLTALTDTLGSDGKALEEASRILRIAGRVIPASDIPAVLVAEYEDGTVMEGEHRIDEREKTRARIKEVRFKERVPASEMALQAIREADAIVLGPGDLYTSTAAALLADGIKEAILESKAKIFYVMNLFTKAGQTHAMGAREHVKEIARYAAREPDFILAHEGTFDDAVLAHYASEGEYPIPHDFVEDVRVKRAGLASVRVVPALPEDPVPRSLARHDPEKLAEHLRILLS